MARDRVPPAQEKVVAQKSGNACAYPDCGVALVREANMPADQDKAVGRAAHICAASEGGPRYDASMTKEERGSARNLVFLCGTHHDAVDSQLSEHTVGFLVEAKEKHERKVARAVAHAMGQVGFEHLEIVCAALRLRPSEIDDSIVLPIEIDEKLELNQLTDNTRRDIQLGLAKSSEVEKFLRVMSGFEAEFGNRLAARFKRDYFTGVSEGLSGDDLWVYVNAEAYENAGPHDSPELRAAVLSVSTHIFTLCEIFDHEPSAA